MEIKIHGEEGTGRKRRASVDVKQFVIIAGQKKKQLNLLTIKIMRVRRTGETGETLKCALYRRGSLGKDF